MFSQKRSQGFRLQAGLSVALLALLTGMAHAQDEGVGTEEPAPGFIDDAGGVTDPPEPIGDDFVMYPIDPLPLEDIDPILVDDGYIDENGLPINTDGIGDGEPLPVDEPPVDEPPVDEPPLDEPPMDEPPVDEEPLPTDIDGIGDGEPLPDVVLDDPMGEELVPEATTQDFPDSTCGGCEYQTMSGGEVIVNRGSDEVQRTVTGSTFGSGNDDASNFGAGVDVVSDENNICYNADLYIPLLCDWQRPFVGDRMP